MSVIDDIMREINSASRRMCTNEIPSKYYRAIGTRKVEEIIRRRLSGKDTDISANTGWIPVEERLPEDAEDVIATTENGEEITLAWYGGDDWRSAIDGDSINVIAWMPLPKPYREEKDVGR